MILLASCPEYQDLLATALPSSGEAARLWITAPGLVGYPQFLPGVRVGECRTAWQCLSVAVMGLQEYFAQLSRGVDLVAECSGLSAPDLEKKGASAQDAAAQRVEPAVRVEARVPPEGWDLLSIE